MGIEKIDEYYSKIGLIKDDSGTLERIKILNEKGRHVIFAPNHIEPSSKIRYTLAMSDDFGALKKALSDKDISKVGVVYRGDIDLKVNGSISKTVYDISSKIIHIIGKSLISGNPIHLNPLSNEIARKKNFTDIKSIVEGFKSQNQIIYPYGNWWPSKRQEFEIDTAFDKENSRLFNASKDGKDKWHKGIKPGFHKLGLMAKVPIVPVYVYKELNSRWHFNFGSEVYPFDNVYDFCEEYVRTMKDLKKGLMNDLS